MALADSKPRHACTACLALAVSIGCVQHLLSYMLRSAVIGLPAVMTYAQRAPTAQRPYCRQLQRVVPSMRHHSMIGNCSKGVSLMVVGMSVLTVHACRVRDGLVYFPKQLLRRCAHMRFSNLRR